MSCAERSIGEANVRLLEAYGVDTVFGIPGVQNVQLALSDLSQPDGSGGREWSGNPSRRVLKL